MAKKEATLAGVAKINFIQAKSYRRHFGESRKILKMRIGETLLCLVAGIGQPDGWQQLEQLMRLRWQEVKLC
jgi:hypothetical protein